MASGDLQIGGLVLYSISYVRASTELGSRVRASAETKSFRGWMTRFLYRSTHPRKRVVRANSRKFQSPTKESKIITARIVVSLGPWPLASFWQMALSPLVKAKHNNQGNIFLKFSGVFLEESFSVIKTAAKRMAFAMIINTIATPRHCNRKTLRIRRYA